MNGLQTIHPVTVVAMTFGSLLAASLMLAVFDLKFVSQTAARELTAPEIRGRTLAAKPRWKDGSLIRRTFRRVSLCDRTRNGSTPSVPLAIARVLASAA
jgi:hypothetical protein